MPKFLLLLAEIIALAVLSVASSFYFGIADGARITLAYGIAYLIPRIVLSRARGTSTTASTILLVLAVFLTLVGFTELIDWTSAEGYSLEMPNLKSDARNYYKWALNHYDGRVNCAQVAFPGFPLMMLYMWRVLGVSVIWPLALNTMFLMLSVVLTGLTTRRLLTHRTTMSASALISGGMLLTCLLCYYLMTGISILKESSVFLSISLAGFSLSSMSTIDEERHKPWRDVVLFVLACALLAVVRTTYLYFILIGAVILVIPHWRRDWIWGLAMIAIIAVAFFLGDHYASYSFDRHAQIVSGGWSMQRIYVVDTHDNYRILLDNYYLYSPLHRLCMLPLTMSVQFIIPFPWLKSTEDIITADYFCRATFGWYLVGGISLFYYLFMSWRRSMNIGLWPWWPAAVFVAMAYIMAGTINRYVLPIEPLFVPVALYVISRLKDTTIRRAFKRWSIFYAILLVATLLICLELELKTFSSALHVQPLSDQLFQVFGS